MLLETKRILSKLLNKDLDIAAFDPEYTEAEERILNTKGITPSTHPVRGFLEVNDSTVLISIAGEMPTKQIISDISKPAILIWDIHVDTDYHNQVPKHLDYMMEMREMLETVKLREGVKRMYDDPNPMVDRWM